MTCKVVEIRPGASREPTFAIACGRGTAPKMCWPCRKMKRERASVALCDGPPPPASMKRTCDIPLCGEHRTPVGPNRDLCPDCTRRAAAAGSIAETHGESDEDLATATEPGAQPSLFDVATPPSIRRIR